MPENKRHHFVPQLAMRFFSDDGKRICLYVHSAGRHVPGASIRDQAYEDYFYGKAGVEQELGQLESSSKPLIEGAIRSNTLPQWQSPEHRTLLKYVLFQDSRTPAKVAENKEQIEKLGKTLARDMPDLAAKAPSINFDDSDAPVRLLRAVNELVPFALDLRWKLLENKTGRLFMMSDNPAVLYNQFLEKRKQPGGDTGIQKKGLQIFLPLDPQHLLMLYDGDVYRVGGRAHVGPHLAVEREADIEALNILQAANADAVLFYSPKTLLAHVTEAATQAKPYRPTQWTILEECPGIGPDGRKGTLIRQSTAELRTGLALSFCGIQPSAAGPHLNSDPTQLLRNPELVRQFQEARLPRGPYDPGQIVKSLLKP